MPADADRKPRTEEQMAEESARYATEHLAIDPAAAPPPARDGPPIQFGRWKLAPTQVFFSSRSSLSIATVNLKPLTPGHVLVIPRRCVPTMAELTPAELTDLWESVRAVQTVVGRSHGAKASMLGVQDGKDAGQSVAHVHVHVLPR